MRTQLIAKDQSHPHVQIAMHAKEVCLSKMISRTWIQLALGSLGGKVDPVLVQRRLGRFGYVLHIFRWIVTGRPSRRVGTEGRGDVLEIR